MPQMVEILLWAFTVAGGLLAVLIACVVVVLAIDWATLPRRRRLRANKAKQVVRPGSWFERPVYFDEPFTCVDCGVAEVWSAESQKWYCEEAKGELYATAMRCARCRANRRAVSETQRRYEELCHRSGRSVDDTLTMAECGLVLVENKVFSPKHLQRIRGLLNSISDESECVARVALIRERVRGLERAAESGDALGRPSGEAS